jgi:ADP-ribose pyrophosphatase YjhB (NUDIX family)
MFQKHSHCSYCGSRFEDLVAWPRHCEVCGNTTYLNPLPVAVVVLPVDHGVLLVRRSIPPHVGGLALPGGYINFGETWQAAAARELFEETGITVDAEELREFRVLSAPEGMLLIFALAQHRRREELPTHMPNAEASEWLIGDATTPVVFDLHAQVICEFMRKMHT